MKNAMKKLMSVLLVAVLLISAVPFAASAAEAYTVDVTVKDASDNILATRSFNEVVGQNSTVQNYLDATFGEWSSNYNVTKYWVKNDETGNDGLTVGADHIVTRTSRVVIKLERKPVTLKLDIYFDGKYTTTVNKSVAYGSTVALNDALAAEAGYGSYNTEVCTATLGEGQSFIADENAPNIQIKIVSGNNTGNGSSSNTGSNSSNSTTRKNITVNIKNVQGGAVVWSKKITPSGATAKVSDILYYHYGNRSNDWMNKYDFEMAYSSFIKDDVGYNGVISEGDTVTIVLTAKTGDGTGNSGSTSNGTITSTKDLNDVILNIFVNKELDAKHTIKLNTKYPALLDDDTISLNEIKNSVVATLYSAKDTSLGLQVDGLYDTQGSFIYNWLTDNPGVKTDSITGVTALRAKGTVCINVMVTNAVPKSTTSTADSSNPKTGDSIYTAMTVMGISAASLAAVMYIYTKKRQAI